MTVHQLKMGGFVGFPEGVEDGADGCLVVASGLFKTGKVVGAEDMPAGFVHGVKIQCRIAAKP